MSLTQKFESKIVKQTLKINNIRKSRKIYNHKIVIVGASTSGLAVSGQIWPKFFPGAVSVFDPSRYHQQQQGFIYQAINRLNMKDIFRENKKEFQKSNTDRESDFQQHKIFNIEPNKNCFFTNKGKHYYDKLIICAGMKDDYENEFFKNVKYQYDEQNEKFQNINSLESIIHLKHKLFELKQNNDDEINILLQNFGSSENTNYWTFNFSNLLNQFLNDFSIYSIFKRRLNRNQKFNSKIKFTIIDENKYFSNDTYIHLQLLKQIEKFSNFNQQSEINSQSIDNDHFSFEYQNSSKQKHSESLKQDIFISNSPQKHHKLIPDQKINMSSLRDINQHDIFQCGDQIDNQNSQDKSIASSIHQARVIGYHLQHDQYETDIEKNPIKDIQYSGQSSTPIIQSPFTARMQERMLDLENEIGMDEYFREENQYDGFRLAQLWPNIQWKAINRGTWVDRGWKNNWFDFKNNQRLNQSVITSEKIDSTNNNIDTESKQGILGESIKLK